jgi:hypothetical protein
MSVNSGNRIRFQKLGVEKLRTPEYTTKLSQAERKFKPIGLAKPKLKDARDKTKDLIKDHNGRVSGDQQDICGKFGTNTVQFLSRSAHSQVSVLFG